MWRGWPLHWNPTPRASAPREPLKKTSPHNDWVATETPATQGDPNIRLLPPSLAHSLRGVQGLWVQNLRIPPRVVLQNGGSPEAPTL